MGGQEVGQGTELAQQGWSLWRLREPGLDRQGQEKVLREGQAQGQGRWQALQQGQGLRPESQFGATPCQKPSSSGGRWGTRFVSSRARLA